MKNKIVYLIIILLCEYNVFVPSDSLQKQELKYVNEYIKLPLPDDSETLIPQGNKVPRYYSLYADKNFDLEEFLAILRRQGWVDHEKYRDNEVYYYVFRKNGFLYTLRIYDNGRWGDGLTYEQ